MSWIITYVKFALGLCVAAVIFQAVSSVIRGMMAGKYNETAQKILQTVIIVAVLDILLGLIFEWPHVESLYQHITGIFPGMTRLAFFMIIMLLLGCMFPGFWQDVQEMKDSPRSKTIIIIGILLHCLWWWKMPAVFEALGFTNEGWPESMWPEVVEWCAGMLASLVGIFQSLFSLQIISALVNAIEFAFVSWEFGLLVIGVEFFTQGYINLWGVYEAVNNFFDLILNVLPL